MKSTHLIFIILLFTTCITPLFPQQAPEKSDKEKRKAQKVYLEKGKQIYKKYACNSCHGDKGVLIGDLTKAYVKYNETTLIRYIKNPKKFDNHNMPEFDGVIVEEDFKPLIDYIRYLGEQAQQ